MHTWLSTPCQSAVSEGASRAVPDLPPGHRPTSSLPDTSHPIQVQALLRGMIAYAR